MAIGDTIYRGSSVWKRLVGNTTTTRKVLCQTGTGSGSAAPTWEAFDGVGAVQRAIVLPTDAAIKGLPTANITLVAAQGANTAILPMRVTLMRPGSQTTYTNIDPDSYVFAIVSGTGIQTNFIANDSGLSLTQVSDFFGSTGNKVCVLTAPSQDDRGSASGWGLLTYVTSFTDNVNQPLLLKMNNAAAGNLTGGTGGNVTRIIVDYTVVATA